MLVISAHYEEKAFTVQESASPPLLFDYYGFPPAAYDVKWPAPGAPALATRVRSLLSAAGLPSAGDGGSRGFDHGVFVPLMLVEPAARIPTLQLSLHDSLDPQLHLRLGAALAPLRAEGVLIIASGFATHNLGEFRGSAPGQPTKQWLSKFDDWLTYTVTRTTPAERARLLAAAEAEAPEGTFRRAHPREEHWTPLLVAVGAAAPEALGEVQAATTIDAIGGGAAQAHAHDSQLIYKQHVNGVASMACFLMT